MSEITITQNTMYFRQKKQGGVREGVCNIVHSERQGTRWECTFAGRERTFANVTRKEDALHLLQQWERGISVSVINDTARRLS